MDYPATIILDIDVAFFMWEIDDLGNIAWVLANISTTNRGLLASLLPITELWPHLFYSYSFLCYFLVCSIPIINRFSLNLLRRLNSARPWENLYNNASK